jgi:hypothetical protein
VSDFWNPEVKREIWRTWKNTHEDLNIPTEINLQPLLDHLNSRKILSQQGDDILRWGHSTTGTFNIQEAYHLRAGHNPYQKKRLGQNLGSKILGQKSAPSSG